MEMTRANSAWRAVALAALLLALTGSNWPAYAADAKATDEAGAPAAKARADAKRPFDAKVAADVKPPHDANTDANASGDAKASASSSAAASTKKPAAPVVLVDINSASRKELKSLPGIGDAEAGKIIAGRPYLSKADLASKQVIPAGVYLSLKNRIIARQRQDVKRKG